MPEVGRGGRGGEGKGLGVDMWEGEAEIHRASLLIRILYWQPFGQLALNHCACRRSAGRIS